MLTTSLLDGIARLAGSVAAIAIILTAFCLMLGILKPADALRRVVTIAGIVILLTLIPAILLSLWSGLPLWKQLGFAGLVLSAWLLVRPTQHAPKNRRN